MAVITPSGYSYYPDENPYGISLIAVLGARSFSAPASLYGVAYNAATDASPIFLNPVFTPKPVFPALPGWRKPVRVIG